jgi:2-keto-3-deoxy-L-rhamnonate aldolase RhmA
VEIFADAGYDYVGIDCQHSLIDEAEAGRLVRPLLVGSVAAVVRVSSNNPASIGRALDAGSDAVIVPMVETAREAASAVAACRYPPRGLRSWGPLPGVVGADPAAFEERASCFAMIESAEGLRNATAICSTPGLRGVYVGPSDLAIGLGSQWTAAPKRRPIAVVEAILRIRDACASAGVIAGIHAGGSEFGVWCAAEGFQLITLAVDSALLAAGAKAQLDAVRSTVGL